jgi:hypothetical protein
LGSGKRRLVYEELRELLDNIQADPPPALLALASITDFDLFISSTPDGLLAQALKRQRPHVDSPQIYTAYLAQGLLCSMPSSPIRV